MGKRWVVLLLATWAGSVSVARAGAPSEGCRQGAELCRDAYQKLEQCTQAKTDAADACKSERTAADAACKTTVSACHRDGSRRPPR